MNGRLCMISEPVAVNSVVAVLKSHLSMHAHYTFYYYVKPILNQSS